MRARGWEGGQEGKRLGRSAGGQNVGEAGGQERRRAGGQEGGKERWRAKMVGEVGGQGEVEGDCTSLNFLEI
jgi:hypothetical protein